MVIRGSSWMAIRVSSWMAIRGSIRGWQFVGLRGWQCGEFCFRSEILRGWGLSKGILWGLGNQCPTIQNVIK